MHSKTVNDVRSWTFDIALPFWMEHGPDRRDGGFVERMSFDGRDAGADFKRTRVSGRQIYVFSHAAEAGFRSAEADEIAERGMQWLIRNASLPSGRWARTLSRNGEVLDDTQDLYDLAFVLFALGWRHRRSGNPEYEQLALNTLNAVRSELQSPHGGYLHAADAKGPRQQNPHMHLLEAALVLYESTRNDRFASLAQELIELFSTRFFDLESGTLAEYFRDDLQRIDDPGIQCIEPGHQFEWAWILSNARRLLSIDCRPQIRRLIDVAERYGVAEPGPLICNALHQDGKTKDEGLRLWPYTERIKAAVTDHEQFGSDTHRMAESSARYLLDHFLAAPTPGLWIDQFSRDGTPRSEWVPSSSLYHLILGFLEFMRFAELSKR